MFGVRTNHVMKQPEHKTRTLQRQDWQQCLWLLLIFLVAFMIAACLPTPGAWSDRKSQWLGDAFFAPISFALFIATNWIFKRKGLVFKLQAVLLWLLFGFAFVTSTCGLFVSVSFLREVHDQQLKNQMRETNQSAPNPHSPSAQGADGL